MKSFRILFGAVAVVVYGLSMYRAGHPATDATTIKSLESRLAMAHEESRQFAAEANAERDRRIRNQRDNSDKDALQKRLAAAEWEVATFKNAVAKGHIRDSRKVVWTDDWRDGLMWWDGTSWVNKEGGRRPIRGDANRPSSLARELPNSTYYNATFPAHRGIR